MPHQPRYPVYSYSGGNWQQPLPPMYYGPQYWGYNYAPYLTPSGAPHPQLAPPSPGRRRERRHSQGSPPPDVKPHLLLGGRYRPTCVWDVSQDPSTARQVTPHGTQHIPSDLLDSPATDPGAIFMKIICDLFPWVITIKVARHEEITVGMVLTAIFGTLQEPLDLEEWEEETNNNRRKMHKAMCARLARGPPEFHLKGEVKRIDSLGDKTFFFGLKPVGPAHAPDEWLLKLGSPPRKEGR